MAGPRSHATVERNRTPEGMAGGRTATRLDGDRTRSRLRLDGGCRRSRLRPGHARPQQRRHCAQSCGWEGSLVEGAGRVPDGRSRTGTARHADRRRRSPLRAQRERRSGVPQDRWHRGVAAQYPARFRRPAAAMADQRVPAGRRPARHRVSRRAGRRHGEAGQDDGKDRLDLEGPQRSGGVFVGHRGGRAGRAHLHDVHGSGGRRRARVRRQADVPVSERREPRREHRDADLLEQQGVLHVRVRHRRRAARSDRAERRGQRERGLLHAQHEEPSRRRRPRRRLSVRVQRFDPDLPRVCDRQDDVAGSQRRQRVGHVRRRPPLHSEREQHRRPGGSDAGRLPREGALPHSRQGPSELGAPGHQRWPPVRPQSGHAARVRHQSAT